MDQPGARSSSDRSWISTVGAWGGLLGPAVIALGSFITALGYTGVEGQSYNLLNHFVSELGEVGVSELALVFNISLVLGGLFNFFFMVSLASNIRGWMRYPLGILGMGAAISGALVGIFPMNVLDAHLFFALGFFNLGMLVALVYSLIILLGKNHPYPRWLSVPGIISTVSLIAFNNFPSQFEEGVDFHEGMQGLLSNRPNFIPLAILEWLVVLGILIWFFMWGIYLIRMDEGNSQYS